MIPMWTSIGGKELAAGAQVIIIITVINVRTLIICQHPIKATTVIAE